MNIEICHGTSLQLENLRVHLTLIYEIKATLEKTPISKRLELMLKWTLGLNSRFMKMALSGLKILPVSHMMTN